MDTATAPRHPGTRGCVVSSPTGRRRHPRGDDRRPGRAGVALDLTGRQPVGRAHHPHRPPRSRRLSTPPLPIVALLAALGIVAVGIVGLRRAQAGLLPAWVPGFLIGGAASIASTGSRAEPSPTSSPPPWSVCTVADLAIVAGAVGWIAADRGLVAHGAALIEPIR